jgi:hypothetical protein
MPWNLDDYPASMKNLDSPVREKAIDIANALLKEGYEDSRAIPIAISQAKKWAENGSTKDSERTIHVTPHPHGWAIRRVNGERASFVFDSRDEARDKAMQMGEDEGVAVVIHGADGRILDHMSFA